MLAKETISSNNPYTFVDDLSYFICIQRSARKITKLKWCARKNQRCRLRTIRVWSSLYMLMLYSRDAFVRTNSFRFCATTMVVLTLESSCRKHNSAKYNTCGIDNMYVPSPRTVIAPGVLSIFRRIHPANVYPPNVQERVRFRSQPLDKTSNKPCRTHARKNGVRLVGGEGGFFLSVSKKERQQKRRCEK